MPKIILQMAKIGFQTPKILNNTYKTYILYNPPPPKGSMAC